MSNEEMTSGNLSTFGLIAYYLGVLSILVFGAAIAPAIDYYKESKDPFWACAIITGFLIVIAFMSYTVMKMEKARK